VPPSLVRLENASGGRTSYTLAAGESWRLESVVATLTAALSGLSCVPTLTVYAPSGEVIAEVRAARAFV
jgi:hypothetical protein